MFIVDLFNVLVEEGYNLQQTFDRNAIGHDEWGYSGPEQAVRHHNKYGESSQERRRREFDQTADERREEFLSKYQIHV